MAALDALLGNGQLRAGLAAALAAGRLAHSILLCGEAGTGTGFAARCLAADYLYPEGGEGARQVLAGESGEVLTLAGEGAAGEIRIDAVRAARREVYNTALSAMGRVVLIKGAQNLNAASANALLKVIEEPPEGAMFILTAPSEAAVLPTIRSRCCVYSLAPVSAQECAQYLAQHFPAQKKDASRLAAVFGGKIGSAARCLSDPVWRAALADALALAGAAQRGDRYAALALLSRYEKDRPGALLVLELYASICSAALRGAQMPLEPVRAAAGLPWAGSASRALSANVAGRLVLTNLAVRLAAPA